MSIRCRWNRKKGWWESECGFLLDGSCWPAFWTCPKCGKEILFEE